MRGLLVLSALVLLGSALAVAPNRHSAAASFLQENLRDLKKSHAARVDVEQMTSLGSIVDFVPVTTLGFFDAAASSGGIIAKKTLTITLKLSFVVQTIPAKEANKIKTRILGQIPNIWSNAHKLRCGANCPNKWKGTFDVKIRVVEVTDGSQHFTVTLSDDTGARNVVGSKAGVAADHVDANGALKNPRTPGLGAFANSANVPSVMSNTIPKFMGWESRRLHVASVLSGVNDRVKLNVGRTDFLNLANKAKLEDFVRRFCKASPAVKAYGPYAHIVVTGYEDTKANGLTQAKLVAQKLKSMVKATPGCSFRLAIDKWVDTVGAIHVNTGVRITFDSNPFVQQMVSHKNQKWPIADFLYDSIAHEFGHMLGNPDEYFGICDPALVPLMKANDYLPNVNDEVSNYLINTCKGTLSRNQRYQANLAAFATAHNLELPYYTLTSPGDYFQNHQGAMLNDFNANEFWKFRAWDGSTADVFNLNTVSIMNAGVDILPIHYAPFLDAICHISMTTGQVNERVTACTHWSIVPN